jgi:hypothetical protein
MGTVLRAHNRWQAKMLAAGDSESRVLVFIPDENGIGNRFMALVRRLLSTLPWAAQRPSVSATACVDRSDAAACHRHREPTACSYLNGTEQTNAECTPCEFRPGVPSEWQTHRSKPMKV